MQNSWLDIRPYMDSAPYSVNESSSVKRCYRFFRTMGLRHLVVVNAFHKVTGIITRNDVTHHRMQSHWMKEVRLRRCCTVQCSAWVFFLLLDTSLDINACFTIYHNIIFSCTSLFSIVTIFSHI